MLKLAIDTSSTSGSFAFAKDDEVIFEHYFKVKITHSETLLPNIDKALKSLGYKPSDINKLLICIGPGSFTGMRIGLATAKGISYGLKIPIVAYTSLELTAANLIGNKLPILSFIDARMKEVYTALYSSDMQELIKPSNCKPLEFLESINTPVIVAGSGVKEYSDLLTSKPDIFHIAPIHLQIPKASGLFSLETILPKDETFNLEQLFKLEPEYLRLSQAELARK
ncbi:MAG: tRNA (adenosine(37)-N6)-threonylcarbamoyltransferase complex dimerization subunit type 1 TsaB [Candidatus Zophobacter franzmannii]|nr:tRNA (adenosine(37)-N6)-threonylcarbamoyltransferase complex dimerization subunit type 1 TsaB [Candidatus Zophobacter franzmannii]